MSYVNSMIGDLKRRRQAMGSSIEDLSHGSGIDEKLLKQWECGAGLPRLDAIERWAAALGVRVAVLPVNSEAASELRVDWTMRNVALGAVAVRLTPMEWRFLERLARSPGELVTHRELFDHLYGGERHYSAQWTGMRVLITKLRRLLRVQIEAKWGRGYVIHGIEPSLPRATHGDCQEFRAEVGHDRSKGAQRCRDAKSLISLAPCLTSCLPAPIPRRLSTLTG